MGQGWDKDGTEAGAGQVVPARWVVPIPLETVSEANARGHWSHRHRRAREQRAAVLLVLRSRVGVRPPPMPLRVRLVRTSPRRLDDDNLRGALKAVRDGVADYLGIDDRADIWDYGQEHGPLGVRIELHADTPTPRSP